ncbi:hypothetical protein DOTSEDRAFT_68927 [Dothistroma septosporum NZE10]|uniref:Zn(2)-C6 fungal-type domain-containing protein n=1 Tax=Dothistroma septosporum (strain NZE10 / CBS 128990) TaxID=675120 RepID=N1Q572_DOTSN|nr:hypothetical protein DOTSEDRAFT_68927 [Dothistroma septosporum NZE10]
MEHLNAGEKRASSASSPSMDAPRPQHQQQQQPYSSSSASEPSRAHSHAHTAPILPPIQHFEQHSMQSQQAQYPQAPVGSQNGAPMQYAPPQFQYQNGAMPQTPMPPNVASGPNGQMRFALPQQPLPQMSGGRHKKEIKRRTKTGCLTCRKRRIKCDEGHPTCRNCQKSKRECLGYDPIFKTQPGPANIQPAPAGNNSQANASATPNTLSINPYQHPQTYPGSGSGAYAPAAGPPPYGTEQSGLEQSTASLDPALSGGDPNIHMAHNNYAPPLQPQRKVKPVQIDELFSLNDIPPRYNLREAPPPVSPANATEIESFYKYHYAQGLDRLFETTWYSARGFDYLKNDATLHDFVAQCAEQFKSRSQADNSDGKPLRSLEARLVWQLAAMPRFAASSANGSGADPAVYELLPRIDTMENLLTGQYLDLDRVPSPPQQPPPSEDRDSQQANQKYNEMFFWHHLARFVAVRDDNAAALQEVTNVLLTLRNILNMLENRDVLYSMAVTRHIGGRTPEFHPQRHLVTSTNDPNDDVNKLKVAQTFVENEDQRGTTQVIQRMCSMAIRAWMLQKQ